MTKAAERFWNNIVDKIAYRKLKRGEATGPVSKALSGVSLFILMLLTVALFKARLYWLIFLLLVSGFIGPLGSLIVVGMFIYFIIVQYWPGVSLLGIYGVVAWVAGSLGLRNIKKDFGNFPH